MAPAVVAPGQSRGADQRQRQRRGPSRLRAACRGAGPHRARRAALGSSRSSRPDRDRTRPIWRWMAARSRSSPSSSGALERFLEQGEGLVERDEAEASLGTAEPDLDPQSQIESASRRVQVRGRAIEEITGLAVGEALQRLIPREDEVFDRTVPVLGLLEVVGEHRGELLTAVGEQPLEDVTDVSVQRLPLLCAAAGYRRRPAAERGGRGTRASGSVDARRIRSADRSTSSSWLDGRGHRAERRLAGHSSRTFAPKRRPITEATSRVCRASAGRASIRARSRPWRLSGIWTSSMAPVALHVPVPLLECALLDQHADHLFDEEGVAVGLLVDELAHGLGERLDLQEVGDELTAVLARQRIEHRAPARPPRSSSAQRFDQPIRVRRDLGRSVSIQRTECCGPSRMSSSSRIWTEEGSAQWTSSHASTSGAAAASAAIKPAQRRDVVRLEPGGVELLERLAVEAVLLQRQQVLEVGDDLRLRSWPPRCRSTCPRRAAWVSRSASLGATPMIDRTRSMSR